MFDLTNPIFTDADKAREYLEKLYWPNGPSCRHCGNADASKITKLSGKSTRPGVLWCNECSKPFTVTVGTVMEDSHIPLNKWVLGFLSDERLQERDERTSNPPNGQHLLQDRMVPLPSRPRGYGRP